MGAGRRSGGGAPRSPTIRTSTWSPSPAACSMGRRLDGGRRPAMVKKVALELGGKNPNIVFADADFEAAVDMALTAVLPCTPGRSTRRVPALLVEDALHDRFVAEVARSGPGGSGWAGCSTKGATAAGSRGAPGQGRGAQARGIAEGAVPGCGGARALRPRLRRGLLLPADRSGRACGERHVRGPGRESSGRC
ncbi:aldehyde dehydrogenase family protein [Streptomyces tricolor]|nr:aldehyde dehydrogenase family protein [Streptomyces tricolor]